MILSSLKRNFGYKVLALIIAICLYIIAYAQQNPRVTREIYVQPQLVGLAPDLALKESPKGNNVTISGLSSTVNGLSEKSITASADATQAREGAVRLPVRYVFPQGIRGELKPEAQYVQVILEKKVSQTLTVVVLVSGTPPVGFVDGEGETQPRNVTVSGRAAAIERVARVVAYVEREDGERAIERTVALVAEDANRRVVEGVEVAPAQAQARVGLKPVPLTRSLLISLEIRGDVAPGYLLEDLNLSPDQVEVSGLPEDLTSQSRLTVPIDITGLKASATRRVALKPPSGLRLKQPVTLTVQIIVRPIAKENPVPSPTPSVSPSPVPTP